MKLWSHCLVTPLILLNNKITDNGVIFQKTSQWQEFLLKSSYTPPFCWKFAFTERNKWSVWLRKWGLTCIPHIWDSSATFSLSFGLTGSVLPSTRSFCKNSLFFLKSTLPPMQCSNSRPGVQELHALQTEPTGRPCRNSFKSRIPSPFSEGLFHLN